MGPVPIFEGKEESEMKVTSWATPLAAIVTLSILAAGMYVALTSFYVPHCC